MPGYPKWCFAKLVPFKHGKYPDICSSNFTVGNSSCNFRLASFMMPAERSWKLLLSKRHANTLWPGSILSKICNVYMYSFSKTSKTQIYKYISQWFWWKKHEQLEKKQHPTSTKQSETYQSSQKSVTFGVLFPMLCPLLSIHLESGVESQSCLFWGSVNPAIPNMFETTFCKGYFVEGSENVAKHQHHKNPANRVRWTTSNNRFRWISFITSTPLPEEGCVFFRVFHTHRIHGTGIFTYTYHQNQPNVGKYIIHGCYGLWVWSWSAHFLCSKRFML